MNAYFIGAEHSYFSEAFQDAQDFTSLAEGSCRGVHFDMHGATCKGARDGTGA
jgi:hypothetical protein